MADNLDPEIWATRIVTLIAIVTAVWNRISGRGLSAQNADQQKQIDELRRQVMNQDAESLACEITTNVHGLIETWDERAVQLFGYRPHEVMGKHVRMLMPREVSAPHDRGMDAWLAAGEHIDRLEPIESVALRKGGERIDVAILSLTSYDTSTDHGESERKLTVRICRRY
jgi:PAS domain S-box-containing protein